MTDGHWTADELRARGWTAALINRFLGRPDRLERPDPRRGPVRLYGVGRVESMERTLEFRAALLRVEKERQRKRRRAKAAAGDVPAGGASEGSA